MKPDFVTLRVPAKTVEELRQLAQVEECTRIVVLSRVINLNNPVEVPWEDVKQHTFRMAPADRGQLKRMANNLDITESAYLAWAIHGYWLNTRRRVEAQVRDMRQVIAKLKLSLKALDSSYQLLEQHDRYSMWLAKAEGLVAKEVERLQGYKKTLESFIE